MKRFINTTKNTKNRSRAGFTITEVLLVVAILVVLFAVTIIGISSYQASLRQKELDSKAEVIYMAAQNRLTELAASGREDLYTPGATITTTGTTSTTTTRADVLEVSSTPVDSEAFKSNQQLKGLYYTKSSSIVQGQDSTAANILPENRVEAEIWDNEWVIEYNPTSGSVYGVFYSEETMSYSPEGFNTLRYKEYRLRNGAKVGYYGGDFVATIDTSKLEPHITVVNEEELYATIACVSTDENITFTVTLTDEFNHTWTRKITRSEMTIANYAYTYRLSLDNLISGRFKDVYGEMDKNGGTGGGLIPGSDITIKVQAECKDDLIDNGSAEVTTNSLFASVEKVAGTSGQADYKQAVITYARHLQNLDEGSGVTELQNQSSTAIITAAVQRSNIHFENDATNQDDWWALYASKGLKFTPIKNELLSSYTGSYSADTGEGTSTAARSVICGLETSKGLFDTFYGTTLKDITLTGTVVGSTASGSSVDYAGALCAQTSTQSLTITGCRVYLDEAEGNLTGKVETDVWISATKGAGGLVGKLNGNVTIEESFAASVVGCNTDAKNTGVGSYTTDYTGGLIGYAADGISVTISKSYADCYLYGDKVGGLIGGSETSNISVLNSYAAGFIYASSTAAGFIPDAMRSANTAYSVMHINKASDTATTNIKSYATAKSYSETTYHLYYMPSGTVDTKTDGDTAVNFTDLSNRAEFISSELNSPAFVSETGGVNTQAYNLMKLGLTDYSFPKLDGIPHYGDWQATFESGTPVYYEVYIDDEGNKSYGIYATGMDSLRTSGVAVGDGYGVVYKGTPTTPLSVTYYTDENNTTTDSVAIDDAIKVTNEYYLLPLPTKAINTTNASDTFYQRIVIDDVTYYYNPHFAKTLTTSEPTSVNSVIYVRTARQLYDMSLYYGSYASATKSCTYTQELNINYTDYEWTEYANATSDVKSQNPIGSGSGLVFSSNYDGRGHTIEGVSLINNVSGSYFAGMFGENKGILKNIFIVWDYAGSNDVTVDEKSTISSSTTAYMGALAGKNSRTIQNCGVAGYSFNARTYEGSTSYIGGLVGQNDGNILNSYADTPKFTLAAHVATVRMGGLVGYNNGNVTSCYASGMITVSESENGNVKIGEFYGQNNGNVKYAYCTTAIISTGSATSYAFGPYEGTISNAYYLADGSYFYAGELKLYDPKSRTENPKASAVTASGLKNLNLNGFGQAESSSHNTKTKANDTGNFPYPATTTGTDGKYVHYGNWITAAQMGEVGVFYWEHETSGSNNGYRIHYIGISNGKVTESTTGTSLCTSHDDGGIISEYGYGYYLKKDDDGNQIGKVDLTSTGFADMGYTNKTASDAIEAELDGFKIYAYTSGTSGSSHLYLDTSSANGTWSLAYESASAGSTGGTTTNTYTFTICPFFGDAFAYGNVDLGQEGNEYEIRSAAQLQYINWNYEKTNATSALTNSSNSWNSKFTYLRYVSGTNSSTTGWNYYWSQTHDLDQQGKSGDSSTYFTPIGSMFYNGTDNKSNAYIAYFAGVYDGNTYAIKNVEIHSDYDMTGVFGITAGAKLENIILYSENNNTIEITNKSTKWYCVGGLVGFAAAGSSGSNARINNCTVSGYTIVDSRSYSGDWGGGSIGGLAGACNMDITKCTAVNDITIKLTYTATYNNVRVGGLIGNLRGNVDSCYAGGEITSKYKKIKNDGCSVSVSIWAGGISGGIVMINYGNLSTLVGEVKKVATVSNSYSYVKMPASGSNLIHDSQSIASIGEMSESDKVFGDEDVKYPYLNVYNCYAYKDYVTNTDDYKKIDSASSKAQYYDGTSYVSGISNSRYMKINNKGNSPYVTYDQLKAKSGETGSVLDLLNTNGKASGASKDGEFSFVTTFENGTRITGKYSFPGDDDLEGRDYPFPTILTQTDTLGNTVNVHYGTWPEGTVSWSNGGRISFDLIEKYVASSKAAEYSLTLKAGSDPSSSYTYLQVDTDNELDESSRNAEVKSTTRQTSSTNVYDVVLKSVREGTQRIRAKLADGSYDDLLVTTSVAMNLIADPDTIEVEAGKDTELKLKVMSASYADDNTKGTNLTENIKNWTFVFDDQNFAEVNSASGSYDSSNGVYKVSISGKAEGETMLYITASYELELGSQTETFTETKPITVRVTNSSTSGGSGSGDSGSGGDGSGDSSGN